MSKVNNGPGILIPPPIIFLIALLFGVGLNYFLPISFFPDLWSYIISTPLIIISFLIILPILKRFKKAGTPFKVQEAATDLVTDGAYKYSRNPGYVSLTLLYIGLGIVFDNVWMLLLLIPVLLLVDIRVIRKEERNLEEIFGEQYLQYKLSVRRWF